MNNTKKTLIGLLLVFLPFCLSAQSDREESSIEKGDFLFNPSITLGWYDYDYALDVVNILPPVAANFEIATSDYFSFGLEAEYGIRRYRDVLFTAESFEYTYQYQSLNFRGSFHYLDLLKEWLSDNLVGFYTEKLDFYLGASTGIFATVRNTKWRNAGETQQHEMKDFESVWRFGYMAGFRYYFSDHFGAFAETGKNPMGWAKIGLTLKI